MMHYETLNKRAVLLDTAVPRYFVFLDATEKAHLSLIQ